MYLIEGIPIKCIGKRFYYNPYRINALKKSLEVFLSDKPKMMEYDFARKMILSLEIKTNNAVEGIYDSFDAIVEAIKRRQIDDSEKNRIINLYRGYQYILKGYEINEDTLYELYSILSASQLDDFSTKNMNKYRLREVFILGGRKGLTIEFDKGIDVKNIELSIREILDYLNNSDNLTMIDKYIASQIVHYLFVYIHPYFDVNGRTARTLSMWYLMNNNAYPFIIFNRAISLSRSEYISSIKKSRTGNLTPFIEYMMSHVLDELEKEHIISNINVERKLLLGELEILEYLMTIGNATMKELYTFFIFYNHYISEEEFIREKIKPLILLGILDIDKSRISICRDVINLDDEDILKSKYKRLIKE